MAEVGLTAGAGPQEICIEVYFAGLLMDFR
jgi:hypothetical protein